MAPIYVAFSLDTCDRGSVYKSEQTGALARSLNLNPCMTRAYSPESNGMAETLVKTIKRDYVYNYHCQSSQQVIEKIPRWFEDYNNFAPHSALKMLSPRQFKEYAIN